MDGALGRLESRLTSTAGALAKFNQTAGTDKALKSFSQLGTVGPRAMTQLSQSGQRSATTLRSAFDELISVHGRYSTSLALLGRITFTQLAIRGLRLTETAFRDAIQASLDFSKQLAEIRSIDTNKIFGADLGDKLRGISSDFNIALPDVASGAYEALSAQVLKTGNDFRFMTAAAQFSKGSLTSMEASVKGLAGALNAYGQGTENVDRLASQFNETIRLGTIRGEELAQNFGTIATLGNQLGVSQAELLAAVAALTNAGVPFSQAFTQVRGVLTGLVKPSEQLAKVFREQGIASAEQLIAARGFGDALKFLREQTDGTTAGTAELFNNQRALLGVLSIGGQNAKVYADAVQAIGGVASSLNAERAQQVMATDAEQLTKKFNTLKTSLIPLGDGFVTIANTSLDAAGVLRDFSVGVLEFTGDLLRGKPAIDQFGEAWLNLQGLFGKDLTIGDLGGKIVSELEIRQRQLDVIARKREEETAAQLKQQEQLNEQLNKLKFAELDNAKAANKQLQTEAQSAANSLLSIEKNKLNELDRVIKQQRQLVKDAPNRIANLTRERDDRRFQAQTSGLPDAQKALAEMQRADALASQAALKMETAARTGNQAALEQARSLFETAKAQSQQAVSTAAGAGARDRELQASRQLEEITNRQIAAEQKAAAIAQSQLPTLEQKRAKEQASLDVMTKATAELVKNSSLFDKQGQQVPAEEAAKRAEARARALKTLLDQGVPKEKIVELQFKTEGALQTLAQQLQAKLSSIDATPFQTAQTAMQQSVGSANAIADAFQRAAAAAGRLNVPTPPVNRVFGGPLYAAAGALARGIDTIPAMLSPGEFVVNAKQSKRFFSQLQAINAGQAPTFRQAGGITNNVTIGDGAIRVTGASGPTQTARAVARELRREFIRRGGGL